MFRDFVHELWEGALEAYLDLLDAEIKVGSGGAKLRHVTGLAPASCSSNSRHRLQPPRPHQP